MKRLAEGHGLHLHLGRHLEDAGGHGCAAGVLPRLGLAGLAARELLGQYDALLEAHARVVGTDIGEVVDDGVRHELHRGVGLDAAIDQGMSPVDDALQLLGLVLGGGSYEVLGVGQGEVPSDVGF